MQARKEKFLFMETKWELKRISRLHGRIDSQKKPLVEPLQIGGYEERKKSLEKGCMIFHHGSELIEVPLLKHFADGAFASLQGLYKSPEGRIVCVRAKPASTSFPPHFGYYYLEKTDDGYTEKPMVVGADYGFAFRTDDPGHMLLPDKDLSGRSLGKRVASMAEKEQRARARGMFEFVGRSLFMRLYRSMGYVVEDVGGAGNVFSTYRKGGEQPFDDRDQFIRIEAIDPKNGKARVFTFTIENPHEIKPNRQLERLRLK